MKRVGVHDARDQRAADVGAAQRRQDEKGDGENPHGCLDPDLAKGPPGIRRVVPRGSRATSPLWRRKIHQLVHPPARANIETRPINSMRLVWPGRSSDHLRSAGTDRPALVRGEGVNHASDTSAVTSEPTP